MENAKLTLYFIPSPFGLNWESPSKLARTIIINKYSFKPRFMGHVNIDIQFQNEQGEKEHILTGMVASNLNAVPLLLKKKIGLGILWHSFPGRLETKEELIPELDNYKKTGKRINFMRWNISHKAAQKLADYYEHFKQNQIDKFYGLVNSPLHGEGSGCSAFGASFLSTAGLLDENFIKNCSMRVLAPMKYIGSPISNNQPNFIKLAMANAKWAQKDEEHKELYFWDPDLMFKYTKNLAQNPNKDFKVIKEDNAIGIEYPLRKAREDDDIFFGDIQSRLPDIKKKSNLDYFEQVTRNN